MSDNLVLTICSQVEQEKSAESALLRRTLLSLLLENELLRSALAVNPTPVSQDEATISKTGGQAILAPPPVPVSSFNEERRRLAVERYLQKKRKRKIGQPTLNGTRYVKMKAVADGKQRNAGGKFVKKNQEAHFVADGHTASSDWVPGTTVSSSEFVPSAY